MKKYRVTVNGTVYEVELEELTGSAPVSAPAAPAAAPAPAASAAPAAGEQICAPMPGNILAVNVTAGQAVMNVIVGKYKTFPKESKGLLRGEYGALPGEVNPEVRALAGIDPEAVITCRPADNIAPELETYKEQFKDIAKSEEDVLSLTLFPQVAPKFLAWRDGPHEAPAQPAEAPKAPPAGPNAVRELFVEYKF